MDILVIDRDPLTNQLLSSKLASRGHAVTVEPNKNLAFDLIREKGFDCIMLDPAPLSEARPVVVGLWRNVRTAITPYLLLLSKTAGTEDAILGGTNDVLSKPFSTQDIDTKLSNAVRLLEIAQNLSREDNVHSAAGMIGKAAFHQLFLAANDRAFRYGERSLVVFVTVTNFGEIADAVGAEAFEQIVKKFTVQMTFMRRQSDVVGRLGAQEFAILLQRPQYESEPLDAVNRFAEALDKFRRGLDGDILPQIHLQLVELPQGILHAERFVPEQNVQVADSI